MAQLSAEHAELLQNYLNRDPKESPLSDNGLTEAFEALLRAIPHDSPEGHIGLYYNQEKTNLVNKHAADYLEGRKDQVQSLLKRLLSGELEKYK